MSIVTTILLVAKVIGAAAFAAVAYLAYIVFLRPHIGKRALVQKIPTGNKHWLLGNLHEWTPGPAGWEYLIDKGNQFKDIFVLWISPALPFVIPCNPEDVQTVVETEAPKSHTYELLHEWLGLGLLTMNGSAHKARRKMLTPAFHFGALKDYFPVFVKHSNALCDMWDGIAKQDKPVDVQNDFSYATLDVIGECAFGVNFDAVHQHEHEFVFATTEATRLFVYRFSHPHLTNYNMFKMTKQGQEFDRHVKLLARYADEAIAKRKAEIASESRQLRQHDFLDILLSARTADGEPMTDQELRDEVTTFMFEGHDTTSSGLQWTMYLLAKHEDWQEKCRQEILEMGDITFDNVNKLNNLDMCLRESHRIFPPVPGVSRDLNKDVVLSGYKVPAGTTVSIHPMNLHNNPKIWPNPTKFDPLRFTREECEKRHNFAYLPFSAGSRNCIGQKFALLEEKVMISTILTRFVVTVPDDLVVAQFAEAVTRNKGPLNLNLKIR